MNTKDRVQSSKSTVPLPSCDGLLKFFCAFFRSWERLVVLSSNWQIALRQKRRGEGTCKQKGKHYSIDKRDVSMVLFMQLYGDQTVDRQSVWGAKVWKRWKTKDQKTNGSHLTHFYTFHGWFRFRLPQLYFSACNKYSDKDSWAILLASFSFFFAILLDYKQYKTWRNLLA